MKKETIINIFYIISIILIGLITLSIANDVQQKAIEECIRTQGNCSTIINSKL